jgi:hypothetical protein
MSKSQREKRRKWVRDAIIRKYDAVIKSVFGKKV